MLAPHLDIEGALKFLALEVVFVNTDGYWRAPAITACSKTNRDDSTSCPTISTRRWASTASRRPVEAFDEWESGEYPRPVRNDRWLDWNKIAPLVVEYQALIDAKSGSTAAKVDGYDRFNPARLQAFFERAAGFSAAMTPGKPEHD